MKDTQDCKNFLGHFFNLNKQFFADFYNIDLTAKTFKNTGAIVDNQTLQLFTYTSAFPNSWKRTFKSISKHSDYGFNGLGFIKCFDINANLVQLPISDLISVRGFEMGCFFVGELGLQHFGFRVPIFEDVNGNLFVGRKHKEIIECFANLELEW